MEAETAHAQSSAAAASRSGVHEIGPTDNPVLEPKRASYERSNVTDWASLFWLPDYRPVLEAEARVAASTQLGAIAPPSTYRARLDHFPEAASAYDVKMDGRVRDIYSIALRAANQRAWSFSQLARSISYFSQRTPRRVWRDETRGRRIATHETTIRLLDRMVEVEPQPAFTLHETVSVFCMDQTFKWLGANKQAKGHRGEERMDEHGMPIRIQHLVYVNGIKLRLPDTLPMLTANDLLYLKVQGTPYTEDFRNVSLAVSPHAVRANLRDFTEMANARIRCRVGNGDPSELSLREIIEAIFGRPRTLSGGPTPLDILPPLKDCDTKSYADLLKIFANMLVHSAATVLIFILFGDGQTVLRGRDVKRKFPTQHRWLLLGCGHFHQKAHHMFAILEMFWYALLCTCVEELGRRKIRRVTKNMDHDSYKHVLSLLQVVTVGAVSFILNDVKDPPPELFLRDLDAYAANVNSGGGTVLLMFLKYGGYVIAAWQWVGRSGGGLSVRKLVATAFHYFRGPTHKVGSRHIALITLLGLCCAYPPLQAALLDACAVSMLGNPGGYVEIDRFVEAINFLQQQRMNSFTGFESGLHHKTGLLKAMLHVDHAWQAAESGGNRTQDVFSKSMGFEAIKLRKLFKRRLGTDLTHDDDTNALWHTGTAVRMDGGDYKERRPWEWLWRVAAGTALGKWATGRPTTSAAYVANFISENEDAFRP